MNIQKGLIAVFIFSVISCNHSEKGLTINIADNTKVDTATNSSIVFTIDGKTRTIRADQCVEDVINFDDHPIKALFRKSHTIKDDNKFEINLNFYEKNILDKIPTTYTLPEDNSGGRVKIDLNFFDSGRIVDKSMNKRLIFDEGAITIYELSMDKIRFDFEGVAHELMNKEKKSPVSGSVHVVY
ncbi:MAG: hypothetical protein RBR78_03375 [Flavobacteriaceae bacterium]|jgi:hypothetical protein|nr:hypothetical protein [Flavobacteriaceae bacterium]